MPEKRMAALASKPMSAGASTVEPNMANTCWTPSARVGGQGSRSSGAIGATVPPRRSVQRNALTLGGPVQPCRRAGRKQDALDEGRAEALVLHLVQPRDGAAP